MKIKTLVMIIFGIMLAGSYIAIANSLKTTVQIWLLTRTFGLIAYASLALLVIIGELRLLGFNKLFRFHCTVGIITFFLALLHGLSAVFDKFKWGISLKFTDFLGFNFSTKWLLLLSFGTLAFYLIIFVAITSSTTIIKKLGFKNWKILHYLSYAVIAVVFVHSTLLGTDIKNSSISWIILPAVVFLFTMATGLLAMRIAKQAMSPKQIIAAALAVLLLSAVVAYSSGRYNISEQSVTSLLLRSTQLTKDVSDLQNQNLQLYNHATELNNQAAELQNQILTLAKTVTTGTTSTAPIAQSPTPPVRREREVESD